MKEKTKKSGRWWYPILAGIAVPLLGILGASLITAGFFALLQAFGTDLTSLGVFPMLMTDIVKIILAAVIILIMKRISHGSFYFGFGAKNLRESIALASIALVFALCNVLEAIFFNGILQENGLVLLASVISALAAGFYEEIACRGVVVTSMMENWKNSSPLYSAHDAGFRNPVRTDPSCESHKRRHCRDFSSGFLCSRHRDFFRRGLYPHTESLGRVPGSFHRGCYSVYLCHPEPK